MTWKPYNPFITVFNNSGASITMSTKYDVGDKVRITNLFDANYGMTGNIIRHDPHDDSFLVEFEYALSSGMMTKDTEWYYGTEEFVHFNKQEAINPFAGIDYVVKLCHHEWKEDKWFTSKVFKTCSKCGAKHEDTFEAVRAKKYSYTDDGTPF